MARFLAGFRLESRVFVGPEGVVFDSVFLAWPCEGQARVVAELAPRWCSFVALAADDESGRRALGQALGELRELGAPGVVPPGWRSATEAEVSAFVELAEDAESEAFHSECHHG